MTVNCGFIRTDQSIQETVKFYLRCGMTLNEAISKAEDDLRTKLPNNIKERVYETR